LKCLGYHVSAKATETVGVMKAVCSALQHCGGGGGHGPRTTAVFCAGLGRIGGEYYTKGVVVIAVWGGISDLVEKSPGGDALAKALSATKTLDALITALDHVAAQLAAHLDANANAQAEAQPQPPKRVVRLLGFLVSRYAQLAAALLVHSGRAAQDAQLSAFARTLAAVESCCSEPPSEPFKRPDDSALRRREARASVSPNVDSAAAALLAAVGEAWLFALRCPQRPHQCNARLAVLLRLLEQSDIAAHFRGALGCAATFAHVFSKETLGRAIALLHKSALAAAQRDFRALVVCLLTEQRGGDARGVDVRRCVVIAFLTSCDAVLQKKLLEHFFEDVTKDAVLSASPAVLGQRR